MKYNNSLILSNFDIPEDVSMFCKIYNVDLNELLTSLIYPGLYSHISNNFRSFQELVGTHTLLSSSILNSLSKEK